jgi:hypothetical protein
MSDIANKRKYVVKYWVLSVKKIPFWRLLADVGGSCVALLLRFQDTKKPHRLLRGRRWGRAIREIERSRGSTGLAIWRAGSMAGMEANPYESPHDFSAPRLAIEPIDFRTWRLFLAFHLTLVVATLIATLIDVGYFGRFSDLTAPGIRFLLGCLFLAVNLGISRSLLCCSHCGVDIVRPGCYARQTICNSRTCRIVFMGRSLTCGPTDVPITNAMLRYRRLANNSQFSKIVSSQ